MWTNTGKLFFRAVSQTVTLGLLFGTVGCSGLDVGSDSANMSASPGASEPYFVDDDTLRVDFEHSPSGSMDFTFCRVPGGQTELNLTNAAWLGWMAANEYSHLGYFAPALSSLGFGNEGAGDLLWVKCAKDLQQLDAFEESHAAELATEFGKGPQSFMKYLAQFTTDWAYEDRWGSCAANWFQTSGYQGKTYPAGAFEQYLFQSPAEGQYIHFFSGGAFDIGDQQFEKGSTQAVFARHGQFPVAIVSFRGTERDQWADVATNARVWRISLDDEGWPSSWGKLHRGFYHGFDSVADGQLMDKIAELEGTDVQIWLTGHSLGGALATTMGARLLKDMEAGANYNLAGIYTFGSPRIGNGTFAAKFDETAKSRGVRVVRIRNGADIVPELPKYMGYRHVGTPTYIDEDHLGYGEDPDTGLSNAIADHSMTGYGDGYAPVSGYYRRVLKHMQNPRFDAYDVCGQ